MGLVYPPAEMGDDRRQQLRELVFRNSVVEVLGYGVTQAIRLGGNLVLTRMLSPEAFGLMAIVQIVLFGLTMLSDVGILQAVIQNRRGDDERFLNTAWTLQAVRGASLCGATWVVAYPASLFYEEPILFPLLLAAGFQLLIAGFESTSLFTLRRRVESLKLATIEVGVQIAALIGIIGIALVWRSVWALLIGAAMGGVVRLVWSHLIDIGYRNRFAWDEGARREIIGFGRWIFGSSIASFLSTQSDRLMLGRLLGMATLGVYGIALMLSDAIGAAVSKVVNGVFYPALSRIHNEDPERLRSEYYHARLRFDGAALPAIGVLAVGGDLLVELLWDPRYVDAGWMLRILCLRVAVQCMMLPCEACLVATGESRFGFARSVTTMLMIVVGVPLGFHLGGAEGLVWAVALSELPAVFILWPAFARRGLLLLRREAFAPLCFVAGAGLASLLRYAVSGVWF